MSALKSIIITLPKGLSKAPGIVPTNELSRQVPKINFTTSILAEKAKMDPKKMPKQEEMMHDENTLFKPDVCLRGKKRRLDHLTWEEKLQRKKLKNRVAAQTSRDRKKAKLDELEETVRMLREKNDLLTQECSMLRSQNDSLVTDAKRLRRERDMRNPGETYCSLCQARVGCVVPSLGSAAGWDNTIGTVPDTNPRSYHPVEDTDPLPPLEELFGDLQGDDYIERLEELAESLLREVTAEVEANPHRSNEQVSVKEDTVKKPDHPKGVVGQASKNVEANTAVGSLNGKGYRQPWHSVSSTVTAPCVVTTTSSSTPVSIKSEVDVKQEESDAGDLDTVYGTYDETTNCITIIYPGEENNMGIQECVQEVSSDSGACQSDDQSSYVPSSHGYSNQFSPAYTSVDSMSPSSIHSEDADTGYHATKLDTHLSDGGYESHDSPVAGLQKITHCRNNSTNSSNVALTDLWHESFTELFPTLA